MLNMLQNNEMGESMNFLPFLTDNFTYRRYEAMAKSNVAQQSKKEQINYAIGKRYGRLTVIKETDAHVCPGGRNHRKFLCLCDCGNTTSVLWQNFRYGTTKSCGCLRKEAVPPIDHSIHGFCGHPLYGVWQQMKSRCSNPNGNRFKDYGGRGIQVCQEWKESPKVFIEWALENGWEKGMVLDREIVSGGYTPSNCRFVDYGLSARNKRLLDKMNTSGYRGVSHDRQRNKWTADIRSDGKRYRLGRFDTPEEAAMAYDKKAKELDAGHPLNFGMEGTT
jgi:hypothetical protein